VQALFIVLALLLPHDTIHSSVHTGILSNLFFWLRVGLGLGFPAVLGWMAYDSSGVRAMQSATGLLYIAMVLVIWRRGRRQRPALRLRRAELTGEEGGR
jgi:hypothetical protein